MSNPKDLKVVSVEIRDVLGATEFSIEPGQVTVLEGPNGSGKSTALQAVQAALGGGNLARLARVDPSGDPTDPEVVLVLEGPGNETYRVERAGDRLRVRARVGDTAGFEDVPRPQGWLGRVFDTECANPVRFLLAPDKERTLMLLAALPLQLDRQALLAEMGLEASELPAIPQCHPLEALELIRDAVFRMRTGVNRDATGKATAAEHTRRNAPAVVPDDAAAQIADAEATANTLAGELTRADEAASAAYDQARRAAEATYAIEEEKVHGSFKTEAAKMRGEHERKAAEIRLEAERQVAQDLQHTEDTIEALREGGEDLMKDEEARREAAFEAAEEALKAARRDLTAKHEALASAREQLTQLRAQGEGAIKARALLEQARQFDAEAARLQQESERLTRAIDALDAYRRQLTKDFPIEGLAIEDKTIRVKGVPFEQLNTAQRVAISVKVAALRAKGRRLPLVFVDGAEALDSQHFEALVTELKAAGLQAFVARVADHELKVQAHA